MIGLSVSFLLKVIVVLLVILFLFTVYLLFQRRREIRFAETRDTFLQNYSLPWYNYLINDENFSIVLVPRGKAQVAAVEIIFSSYLKNILDEKVEQKIKEFSNLYLKEFYEKDLSSRRWSIRMNALYRIADFKIDELLNACQQFEKSKISEEENFQLLKIYSLFQPELFIEKIKELTVHYSESEYRRLFVLLEDDIFIRLFEDFDSWTKNIQFAAIDTAAVKRNMQYIDQLKQLLTHEVPEIQIRALKGLYEIGVIDEIDPYVPFVTSDMWEVRLMVAKIFKHVPLNYSYTYLEQLLEDENWWVRSQAAKTIAENKEGIAKLQQFMESSNDQYAIEMAQESVVRKQGNK
ncbi:MULTISPECIES: HEAT repeat domain-containing protein [unclassified Lysinibacillus]|uniref:HEAT repeat domain-containing protein n=1 Tax=unclassified Lysinibacillus TaxID=2636778 RepID=UPI0020110C8F|nr:MULTISPECIES: HEAT repeat domain-containing protein [unclassified Lysinibacillus]MCL1697396.1 HEAT repeat domain-containing protein [Lysinibacillus sp. BPa_S21]MCL1702140.1 HEAT repeat domain-containing protein [Lysinibacillus sp. Bpr_S20]